MRDHLTDAAAQAGAIDFAHASLTWQLAQPRSAGRFAIDAALSVVGADGTRETFFLGAQVLAGNVYGTGPLFKLPAYEFAAVFSDAHYRIFRSAHGGTQADSCGSIASGFAGATLDVPSVPCRPVEARGAALQAARGLVAKARLPWEGGAALELQFPVRHLNTDVARDAFQVETGPVLALAGAGAPAVERLRRAYVIFNRLDRLELLLDDPAAGGARWGARIAWPCKIELLRIGE